MASQIWWREANCAAAEFASISINLDIDCLNFFIHSTCPFLRLQLTLRKKLISPPFLRLFVDFFLSFMLLKTKKIGVIFSTKPVHKPKIFFFADYLCIFVAVFR
jgi:hypothetical protein